MAHILTSILSVLVVITSFFLICLVLIQRGKGGGLAGAFGGSGGSSAFGTKAGDVFTKITMVTAICWILMLMALVITMNNSSSVWEDDTSATPSKSALPGAGDIANPPISGGDVPPAIPTPTPSPANKAVTPDIPPISSTGPSAPLVPSPSPAPAPSPATAPTAPAEKPAAPKS